MPNNFLARLIAATGHKCKQPRYVPLLWLLVISLSLGFASVTTAAPNDQRYYQIYTQIDKADELAKVGQREKAKAKYQDAWRAMQSLKEEHPNYNPKLVASRLDYLLTRIDILSKPPEAKVTESAEEASDATITRASQTGAVRVKLLEAGAEPRTVLRLQANAGEIQKLKMVIRLKMALVASGVPSEAMSIPPMNMTATLTTKSVSSLGEAAFEVVINEAGLLTEGELPQEGVEAMRKQLEAVKGVVMTGTLTDRYYNRKMDAKVPSGASAEVRESINDIKDAFANTEFILPEEAIGVGASWEVKQKTKNQGVNVDQTIKHELVSMDGNTLTIKSTTSETAANQKIPNPILPALKVDMTKMTGTGTENATIDLTKLMPIKSTAENKTEIVMSVATDSKKQSMTMKMETQATLESE